MLPRLHRGHDVIVDCGDRRRLSSNSLNRESLDRSSLDRKRHDMFGNGEARKSRLRPICNLSCFAGLFDLLVATAFRHREQRLTPNRTGGGLLTRHSPALEFNLFTFHLALELVCSHCRGRTGHSYFQSPSLHLGSPIAGIRRVKRWAQ